MGNPILNAPQYYVLDTNTIIDLYFGRILPKIFELPCRFSVTDFLASEFHEPPYNVLDELGLQFESLSSEEVAEISPIREQYPKTSFYDVSVLILARSRNTVLITGDRALRIAAENNGVDCRGTCWLIDYLAREGLVSYTEAIEAYKVMKEEYQHPTWEECQALLNEWRKRQKLE